jgi:3'-5' exoribonuclease
MTTQSVDSVEAAEQYLSKVVDVYLNKERADVCAYVLNNADFKTCPGSGGKHHAFKGGLMVHTAQVVELVIKQHQAIDTAPCSDAWIYRSIIAAIFHDFSKIKEYDWMSCEDGALKIEKTKFRAEIGHIADSYHEFVNEAERCVLPYADINAIGHLILSHHGRQEWGSPVEPQNIYAQILHNADYISAFYMGGPLYDGMVV